MIEHSLLTPLNSIIAASLLILLITIGLVYSSREFIERQSKKIFIVIVILILLPTAYSVYHTLHETVTAEVKGTLLWNAEFEVHYCGRQLDLKDPTRGNKIGELYLYEKNDGIIHADGIIADLDQLSLGNFFQSFGGELKDGRLKFPTNNWILDINDGEPCPGDTKGSLEVYVNGMRIYDYENYILYPSTKIPPGDCIIITFDTIVQDRIDITCKSWEKAGKRFDDFKRRPITIGERTWN